MFRFNTLKHHLTAIRTLIASTPAEQIPQDLLKLGGSQMDLYIGGLSIPEIEGEIYAHLSSHDLLTFDLFQHWIITADGYRQVVLSDQSEWVLRMGDTREHYIHIHPARYAKNTIRVKANTLKTAILLAKNGIYDFQSIDITQLNHIRIQFDLSPIRTLKDASGIERILCLLKNSH